ncbi:hypothetical protein L198_02868 [Cryptococcus wingfieldii CBS 7118]|uniref:F-box domain-containing protein n=1 Tax=Cryptococcus wingfieldii CBS 7118 TaxID=1295528 RepID=A0A1E3JI29_9TREE|nr:hypothetical protein L198_02868 [Cryptococcus wingfieldii CBS 7118]ODO00549.1 hypothetical protein L198_02868 [Cryptococcus wingfieldii CBS 7118]
MSSNIPTFDVASILSSLPDDILHLVFDAYASSLPTQSSAFLDLLCLDLLCLDRRTYNKYLPVLYRTIELTEDNRESFFQSYSRLLERCTFAPFEVESSDTSFFVPRLGPSAMGPPQPHPDMVRKIIVAHHLVFEMLEILHSTLQYTVAEQVKGLQSEEISVRLFPHLEWLTIGAEVSQAPPRSIVQRHRVVFRVLTQLLPPNICCTEPDDQAVWLFHQLGQAISSKYVHLDSMSIHASRWSECFKAGLSMERCEILSCWPTWPTGVRVHKDDPIVIVKALAILDRLDNLQIRRSSFPRQRIRLYDCNYTHEELFSPTSKTRLTLDQMSKVEIYTPKESAGHVCEGCGKGI